MQAEADQNKRLDKLEDTTENLEEVQYTQVELDELKHKHIDNTLEKLNHKLHTLSNFYMGLEEKINELAEYASQLKVELDDLRQSIESFNH